MVSRRVGRGRGRLGVGSGHWASFDSGRGRRERTVLARSYFGWTVFAFSPTSGHHH